MDSIVMKNRVLKLDKSSWVLTKLGDLARDISKRVDNPGESEYDRFVGLRNFVTGDIKIKSWETTENLASSAKAFQAGDILFARRNAYLRRASLVEFDGCCSGDAFVLRENHDKIIPGFLAFLMNSNALWDYANSNAAGTMSKRVKWRDLAEYEFLIPPKYQQAQLVKLLWSMDDVIERGKELIEKLKLFQKVKNKLLFNGIRSKFEFKKFGDVCDIERGGSPRPIDDYITDDEDGLNWIKIGDVDIESKYITKTKQKIKPSGLNKTRSVHCGDLILSNSMSFGRPYILKIDGCIHDGWLVIRDKQNVFDKDFLYYYLSSDEVFSQFEKFAAGGVVSNLNKEIVKKLKIYLPPMNIQIQIKEKLSFLDENNKLLMSKILSSQSLQKSLINQIF